jgi:hypothetical protein
MIVVHLKLDYHNLQQSHRDLPVRTWHQVFVLYVPLPLVDMAYQLLNMNLQWLHLVITLESQQYPIQWLLCYI